MPPEACSKTLKPMTEEVTILLLGAGGQLGRLVAEQALPEVRLLSLPRDMLDVADSFAVKLALEETRPDIIINCAAYTAVDRAEAEVELAFAVNVRGPENLAEAMAHKTRLIHISTDFVFTAMADRPYQPEDPVDPQSAYGKSKREGERILLEKRPDTSTIIRTSWLYSADGRNFVNTMLRLMNERDELSIVSDQFGSPTSAEGLAGIIWKFVARNVPQGLYHWSDEGVISWYDFACGIQRIALDIGLLEKEIRLIPIRTEDYPVPARRPAYSALDSSTTQALLDVKARPWKDQLHDVLVRIKEKN